MSRARGLAVIPVLLLAVACSSSAPTAAPTTSPHSASPTPASSTPNPSPTGTPTASPPVTPSAMPSPSTSPSPSASGIAHGTGRSDLVLRITIGGGFVNPTAQLFALPEIAIYGDGTVLMPDPNATFSLNGVVPHLLATTISEAGLQKILAAASDAGLLGKNAHYEGGPMAEAATTIFTLIAEGHTHTISVLALGHPGGDPSTQAARDKLAALEQALQDVTSFVGAANVTTATAAFEPTGLEVFVATYDSTPVPSTTIAWPLSTALADFGQPIASAGSGGGVRGPSLSCGIVTGADLAALLPKLANATQESVWNSQGSFFSLTLRPQLPDELACPGI